MSIKYGAGIVIPILYMKKVKAHKSWISFLGLQINT